MMVMYIKIVLASLAVPVFLLTNKVAGDGMLYPIESESRTVKSLDGIWAFRLANNSFPTTENKIEWYRQEREPARSSVAMPVPSSYNDITVHKDIRDHVGVVWYDRSFYVPDVWETNQTKVWLRFGGVHYSADVFVNDELVASHAGGHVPFQVDVSDGLFYRQKNFISVAVNNTLTDITVPQGSLVDLETDEGTKVVQSYTFDFFNYAGIHRSVVLYTTPSVYVDDITVNTDISDDNGIINYSIFIGGDTSNSSAVSVSVLDREGGYVIRDVEGQFGELQIPRAKLWWPYLMDSDPGYMYSLEVKVSSSLSKQDVYRLPVGIRKIVWSNTSIMINGKEIYFRGFGRHEDSNIRGKGHDFPLIVRDYNLIKWLGANSYRTSHYPYSDEIMDFADREGIMIIDECPGVNIGAYGFSAELLEAHKTSLTRLYNRDKNRPSVIMWSVANEARSSLLPARDYFSDIASHMKSLDPSRPITMAINRNVTVDLAGQFMDVISFNKYNAWYNNAGRTDTITKNVINEATEWHKVHNKPVLMSEYGADTMAGLHFSPEYIWSEEYQVKLLSKHFMAFDQLRKELFFIGEMIWNFADFNTAQTYTRVGGNKKGVFTRDRQPKAAAHLLRKRYWSLAVELDGVLPPEDVEDYISDTCLKYIQVEPRVTCVFCT